MDTPDPIRERMLAALRRALPVLRTNIEALVDCVTALPNEWLADDPLPEATLFDTDNDWNAAADDHAAYIAVRDAIAAAEGR